MRQLMAVMAPPEIPELPDFEPVVMPSPMVAAPTDVKIGYSTDVRISDALSFRFADAPQPGDTWNVLENGVPIPVNTRYYRGLTADTWETTIAAVPFDFTSRVNLGSNAQTQQIEYRDRESWDLAANPVILPTAYGLRTLTAGNRYEIRVTRGGATTTSPQVYGRFSGDASQTGTVALLDLDYGVAPPAGVAVMQAMQGEQVSALVLDAGKKVTLRIGEVGTRSISTPTLDVLKSTLKVETNRTGVVAASVARAGGNEWTLTLDTTPLRGRSGLVSVRIVNTDPAGQTVAPRYLGVIVRNAAGQVPSTPDWLAVGAVNTNDADAQNFFRGATAASPIGFTNFDTQYIYLNDGPLKRPTTPVTSASTLEDNPKAWRTASGAFDGKKLIQSLRESAKFGALPQIVYYNIMAPDESRQIALANLQNTAFMVEYFKDLKFTIDTIRRFANGASVSLMLEPDLLAYMMQSAYDSVSKTYAPPSTIPAMTEAAYASGFLADPGAGQRLPNTLPGFIEAINRGIRALSTQTVDGVTQSVNLLYGWKFNLWATEVPGGGSIAKVTDSNRLGWAAGRRAVQAAATTTADWYRQAGILTGDAGRTMDFIALDKYGTDGGATDAQRYPQNGPGYTDPANAPFFWNADHWNNYLLFAKTLHDTLDGLPVRLWQLPVGHINGTQSMVKGQQVADLANIDKEWEDSAVSYFFGDAFSGTSRGRADASAYFLQNQAKDPLVSRDPDGTVVWGSHMAAARDAGIDMMMFGPGLANSTQGGGYQGPPRDGWLWADKATQYLKNPLAVTKAAAPAAMRVAAVRTTLTARAISGIRTRAREVPTAAITVERTGNLSRRLVLPVRVVGGSADAGSDYRRIALENMVVRFQPGQSAALLVVPTLPTRLAQPRESLSLQIGGANASQPKVVGTITLGATAASNTAKIASVGRFINQFRAVESFSNPTNPGQIVAQLRAGNYPDPTAANRIGEVSATNGLSAYPADGRNTPGAFQVDLASIGSTQDRSNEFLETFGEWKGTAGSMKNASPYDTQIAFSKATLSEFFGVEVDAGGLITRIPAAAAAVFLHDDAIAGAPAAWNSTANPLIGLHIDTFQTEQLSLYLAGRSPLDASVGVQDSRTAPQSVMDLSNALQVQVARSFIYATYQKYLNHPAYKQIFAAAQKLFGATLKITASTAAFGVAAGQEFWCRINGSFVTAGAYVRGEVSMFNLLTAFVEASRSVTGTGTWVIDPNDPSKNVTFTRVTPAGTAAQDAVFTVDKTPLNIDPMYPSIFHYGAVVSPLDDGIDWNDKTAWNVTGRNAQAGLGYDRLAAARQVTGTSTVSAAGRYVYHGLGAGGTLTLTGAGPFVIVPSPSSSGLSTGVIDASQTTGNVLVVVDDSVATVKLGRGRTVVLGLDGNIGAKTYLLNPQPLIGGARPFLGIKAGDTIDARLVTGLPVWTIDNREMVTFDNNAGQATPYRRYAAFSRYSATGANGTTAAEFAVMLRSASETTDLAAVVRAALRT